MPFLKSTLVPIHIQLRREILIYVQRYGRDLTERQEAALIRYAEDERLMQLIANSLFQEWWDNERPSFDWLVNRTIQDIIKVYCETPITLNVPRETITERES